MSYKILQDMLHLISNYKICSIGKNLVRSYKNCNGQWLGQIVSRLTFTVSKYRGCPFLLRVFVVFIGTKVLPVPIYPCSNIKSVWRHSAPFSAQATHGRVFLLVNCNRTQSLWDNNPLAGQAIYSEFSTVRFRTRPEKRLLQQTLLQLETISNRS